MKNKQNEQSRAAIREIHIEKIEGDLVGLHGYQQALIVFRFQGAVVGQVWMPVNESRISSAELRSSAQAVAWPVWLKLMARPPVDSRPLPSASVVVCTRNRTSDLKNCLLTLLPLVEQGHEVLIVDNCPDDDLTKRLVSKYPAVRYVLEPIPGLDTARNRGLRTAHGEIVAFTDDDAIVDDEWLSALLKNFQDPTVAVVTGITMPLELESEAQYWFEITNSFKRGFLRQRFEASTMDVIAAGQVGAGVNMAVRRSALGEIGYFDEALDAGTPTLSGGDQEFFYRTLAAGYRIIYEPAALVWHRHRRTWEELRYTLYGYGVGVYAWWTRALFIEGEWLVPYKAAQWFLEYYVRNLIHSFLGRSDNMPINLAWAQLKGVLAGPLRYYQSSHQIKKQNTGASRKMCSASLGGHTEDIQPSVGTDL